MIVAQIQPQLVTENGFFKPDSLTWDKIHAAHILRSLQGNVTPPGKRVESSLFPSSSSLSSFFVLFTFSSDSASRIHKVAFCNEIAQPVPLCRQLRGTPLPGTVPEQGVGSSAASAVGKLCASCTRVDRNIRSQWPSFTRLI